MIYAYIIIFLLITIQVSLNGWRDRRNRSQFRRRNYNDLGKPNKQAGDTCRQERK